VRVIDLRCEYAVDPIGLDELRPRLSWRLESEEPGQRQTSAEIVATSDGRELWRFRELSGATSVAYRGPALLSRRRVEWRVRAWDRDGRPTEWSAPASWEMGLLDAADWTASWIGRRTFEPVARPAGLAWIWYPEGAPALGAPAEARAFRRVVTVPEARRARVFLTADDRFTLWVNGRRAGGGDTWTRFFVVEIELEKGDNVVAVEAVNTGGPAGLIGWIEGVGGLDGSWKASKDRPKGWTDRGFDDSAWVAAETVADFGAGPWTAGLSDQNIGVPASEPSPYLRRTFTLDAAPRRARLYVTALGLVEVRLNGGRVGAACFAPGWTDYRKRLQVDAYDVTGLLRPGENVIGAILGDGWYAGRVGWLRSRYNYGPPPLRLLLQLEVDGRIVASDAGWKGSTGAILANDLLDGETHDARLEPVGWDRAGFDDSAWRAVEVFEPPKVPLVARAGPPVRVTQEWPAKAVSEPKAGVFVFDAGENVVGWARIQARGPAGTAITLRFAEMLNPDGTIYTANLRSAKCADRYVLRGDGEEVWEPRFTFRGFRYVEATGWPGRPTAGAVTVRVAHTDLPVTGRFACSNAMLTRLFANIVRSQRGNFLEVPTDCPQRDERLGWMGDAQIFAATACFVMEAAPFYAKWMRDVEDAQSPEGAFPDVAPRIVHRADGAPAWGDAGVLVPWTACAWSGDRRLLERHFDAMKRWVAYVAAANPDRLWRQRVNSNFGDWLNVQAETPKDLLATAFFARSAWVVARAAQALGHTEDAAAHDRLFVRIRDAFRREFVDDRGRLKGGTQTAYALALEFDLVADPRSAARHLVEDIERRGGLSTGFVGVAHLLPALTRAGRVDVAYRLATSESFPSWGFSIKHGATSIWERWDGWHPERGFQDPGMNSFNHYAFGSVGQWMVSTILGIEPLEQGFGRISIAPVPGGGLTWAEGEYRSAHGPIRVRWEIRGGEFALDVTIPPNTTAEVRLPGRRPVAMESGSRRFAEKLP
jgi:alpha-L-rhamnosidase